MSSGRVLNQKHSIYKSEKLMVWPNVPQNLHVEIYINSNMPITWSDFPDDSDWATKFWLLRGAGIFIRCFVQNVYKTHWTYCRVKKHITCTGINRLERKTGKKSVIWNWGFDSSEKSSLGCYERDTHTSWKFTSNLKILCPKIAT